MECHGYGRKGVKAWDMVTPLGKTLATGSVRLRTYGTRVDRVAEKWPAA